MRKTLCSASLSFIYFRLGSCEVQRLTPALTIHAWFLNQMLQMLSFALPARRSNYLSITSQNGTRRGFSLYTCDLRASEFQLLTGKREFKEFLFGTLAMLNLLKTLNSRILLVQYRNNYNLIGWAGNIRNMCATTGDVFPLFQSFGGTLSSIDS